MNQGLRARKGFTLIELLVVVVIIGILATVAVGGFGAAQDRSRNSSMITNVRTTFLGVENWRADKGGSDLPTELFGADSATSVSYNAVSPPSDWPRYLPGGQVPKSPWCKDPQLTIDDAYKNSDVISLPWFDAVQDAGPGDTLALRSDNSFADGTIPAGTVPASGRPSERKHYGFMYYVGNKNNGRYAILGVGKRGKEARVFAVRSNFQ